MKANFALKFGRDEWTRTTDPHLIARLSASAKLSTLLRVAPHLSPLRRAV